MGITIFDPSLEYNAVDDRLLTVRGRIKLMRWDQLHTMKWVPYEIRNIPVLESEAVVCGDYLYLARAEYGGSFIPGYVDGTNGCCYISSRGMEKVQKECEVLCTPGQFVPYIDSNTLLRATPAGITDKGEPLYIGRVKHNGQYIHGKVQQSHQMCCVPIDGKEKNFKEYDIFIRSALNPEVTDVAATVGCWVTAVDGQIPRNAIVGGRDGEDHYIGRAHHRGSLSPGKVVPSNGMCHVAWGGREWQKEEFEVLCNVKGKFVPTIGANIPPNAYPAGQSERGETLFIGRVDYEDTWTLGRVQPLHGTCYVPYEGREIPFYKYETFVTI